MNSKLFKRYFYFLFENPGRTLDFIKNPKFLINHFSQLFGLEKWLYMPDLQTIVVYLNSVCNLKCKMCDVGQSNNKGIDRLRSAQKNKNLNLNLFKKLLEDPYIKKKKITFYLLMTEPLLYPKLSELIKMIKKEGHYVTMSTNGYLLPNKAKELADSGLDALQVSIDGPEKIHDYIRGVKGTYKRAIKGIKKINKYNIPVTIGCTIFCMNQGEILNFIKSIDNEGIKVETLKFAFQHFISPEMQDKQNKNYEIKQTESCLSEEISPKEINIKKLSKNLKLISTKHYKNIKNISVVPFISDEKSLSKYFDLKGEPIPGNSKCFMPWHQFAFTTDGKILIHIRCFNFFYGNFNKENIKEFFFNKRIKYFRRLFKKSDFCFPACTRCCGVMGFGLTTNKFPFRS